MDFKKKILLLVSLSTFFISCKSYPIIGLTHYTQFEQKKENTDVITWQLIKMNNIEIAIEKGLSLRFHEKSVGLYGGCNGGSGELKIGKGSIIIESIRVSSKGCPTPGVLKLERKYYSHVSKVKTYMHTGNTLVLIGDNVKLTYRQKPVVLDATLVGEIWVLQTIFSDQMAMAMRGMENSFFSIKGNSVIGNTGCTKFTAKANIKNNTLNISDISLKEECLDKSKVALHESSINILKHAKAFKVKGKHMTLIANSELADYSVR